MIYVGDVFSALPSLESDSFQCVVTSPPYWGLRDYGVDGQLGLEKTPKEYVKKMVEVFREVRRVLRKDGVLWLNLGDTYSGYHGNSRVPDEEAPSNKAGYVENMRKSTVGVSGLKPKDLVGIPWRVAFALQADGWWLRQDIIWHKPNPMPESIRDRCTKAHEYIFMLTKAERYYYDADAVKEDSKTVWNSKKGFGAAVKKSAGNPMLRTQGHGTFHADENKNGRNRRSVWTISTKPFKEAHFATFPPEIPEVCIRASSRTGDTVLDPFAGAGTTGLVAQRLGREFVGIELNREYAEMAERRLLSEVSLPFLDSSPDL